MIISEQQKITEILSEVDAKIEKEEATKAELEQLKKGLMQVLLTGKVRVIEKTFHSTDKRFYSFINLLKKWFRSFVINNN